MTIQEIRHQIVDSYQTNPLVNDHCACRLPSNQAIKEIIRWTKELVFPGYFSGRFPSKGKTTLRVSKAFYSLKRVLIKQIHLALLYANETKPKKPIRVLARSITLAYLSRIPYLREILITDLDAHFTGDPAAFNRDQIVLSYPGFYAIEIYRFAHELALLDVPMLPRMMTEFAHRETGIDINPFAMIGHHFMIDHGTGVVIGETTILGNYVKLYQGVTLGALSTKGGQELKHRKRHPTVGDSVTIYSGASILGGDTLIGEGATIGSNAFITESVAPFGRVSMKQGPLKTNNEKEGH